MRICSRRLRCASCWLHVSACLLITTLCILTISHASVREEEIRALFADAESAEPPHAQNPAPHRTAEKGGTIVPGREFVADSEGLLEFARTLAKTPGQEPAALETYDRLIAAGPVAAQILRERAGLLHRMGRYEEAAKAYGELGEASLARNERLAWAEALKRSGNPAEGAKVLQPLLNENRRDILLLDAWTDLMRRAGNIGDAAGLVRQTADHFPSNPSLQRRAMLLALETANAEAAEKFANRLVEIAPDDPDAWKTKAGLLMARREFLQAEAAYARAIALNPADLPARRQLFRIQNILGRTEQAEESLTAVFSPSADEKLLSRLQNSSAANSDALNTLVQKAKKRAREPFSIFDEIAGQIESGEFGAELSPSERAAVLLALRDTQELRDEQAGAWLELQAARASRTGRNIEASKLYRRLTAMEPDNISALYGLAGALNGTGNLEEARAVYESLLEINPGDPVAAGALRKAADLLRDVIRGVVTYAGEDAPGRLANIQRLQFSTLYQTRLAHGLVVQAGPVFWLEMPKDSRSFTAQGFRIAATYRAADWLNLSGNFGYKAYNQGGAKNTFTGGAGAELSVLDRVRIGLAYLREDVIRNRFNLPQGTQTDNIQLTVTTFPHRDIVMEAYGRGAFYSDSNSQAQLGGSVSWTLLRKPGQLVARLGGLGMWTAKESRDVYENGELVDVIHPYWTPKSYGQATAALIWSQNLAPEAYAGQKELSYRLGLLASTDTTSNFLMGGEVALRWEIIRNLILEAAASLQRSQQWNGAFATITADYRF